MATAHNSPKKVLLNDIPSRQRLSHIEDRISFSLFERLSSNESASSLGLSFSLTPGEDALKEHEHVLTIGVGSPVQIGNLCITSSRLLLLAKSASPAQLRRWYDDSQSGPAPRPPLLAAPGLTEKRGSFRRGSQKVMKRAESLVHWKSEENITRNEIARCQSPDNGPLIVSCREPLLEPPKPPPKPSANNRKNIVSPNGRPSPSPSPSPLRPSLNARKAFTILRKSKTQSSSVDYKSTFYCPIDLSKAPLDELPIKQPNSLKPSVTRSKNKASKSFTAQDMTYSPVKTMDRIVSIRQNESPLFRTLPPPTQRSESFCVTSQQFDTEDVRSLPELCERLPYLSSPPADAKQQRPFCFELAGGQQVSIPYGLISRLERIPRSTKLPLPSPLEGFRIVCKNCQTLTILFHPKVAHDLEAVTTSIEFFLNFQSQRSVHEVALSYRGALRIPDTFSVGDHPGLYRLDKELSRLGLKKTQEWRVFELHPQNPALPVTYPPRLVVPLSYADADICRLAPLYRENRFPVVCWRHPGNRAALLRSGATPRRRANRSQLDGDYMAAVCHNSSRQGDKLVLLCERESSELIEANQPSVASQEKLQTFLYPGCVLECSFSPSPLPKLRTFLLRLQALLSADAPGDYLTQLQSTRWLREVSKLLQTARFVAERLEYDGMSVLVSFEAGFDFTTQVVSLAQLLLDPYYRTMDGFQVLIQKEWIWFGHRFQQRNLPLTDQGKEESPVFIQFIDCVWQIMQQFPSVFEFNEEFLHFIILHSYSGRFGDFLSNCVDEYLTLELDKRTLSLWTWLHYHNLESNVFYNNSYHLSRSKSAQQPLHTFVFLTPECCMPVIRPWTSYYAKYNPGSHSEPGSGPGLLSSLRQLSSELERLRLREHELKQQLDRYASGSSSGSEEEDTQTVSRERQARALSFGLKYRGSLKRDLALSPRSGDSSTFFSHLHKDLISEAQETKEITVSMYVCSGFLYRQNTSVIGTSKRFWAVCDLNKNYFALFLTPDAHSKQEVPKHIFKLSEMDKVQLANGSNPSSLTFSFLSKGKPEKFHASSKACSTIWYNCLSIRCV